MKTKLPQGYRFIELPNEEFQKLWGEWGKKIFSEHDTSMDVRRVLSDEERTQVRSS